jgi:hypothetical protein
MLHLRAMPAPFNIARLFFTPMRPQTAAAYASTHNWSASIADKALALHHETNTMR